MIILISGIIKNSAHIFSDDLRMLISFSHDYIHPFIIRLKSLRFVCHILGEKIRLPLGAVIRAVRQDQRIIRRPPAPESSTAVSVYEQLVDIICLAQKETGIKHPVLIQLIQISQGFFCLGSYRSVHHISIVVKDPSPPSKPADDVISLAPGLIDLAHRVLKAELTKTLEEAKLRVTALCTPQLDSPLAVDATIRYIAHQLKADIVVLDAEDLAEGGGGVLGSGAYSPSHS